MSEEKPQTLNRMAEPNAAAPAPEQTGKPSGDWRMPEPEFRQSSGYLPQGFEKRLAPVSPAVPAVAVEPQPDIAEVFTAEPETITRPVARRRNGLTLAVVSLLAIMAIVAILVVFLIVVYFLLRAAPGDTNF